MKLNVQFTARQSAAIDALAAELGVSKSRVFQIALAILAVARREEAEGNRLAVVRGGAVVKEIVGLS